MTRELVDDPDVDLFGIPVAPAAPESAQGSLFGALDDVIGTRLAQVEAKKLERRDVAITADDLRWQR